MLAKFISIQQLDDKKQIILKGEISEHNFNEKKAVIFFQERLDYDDFFIPNRIFLETNWNKNFFTIPINLDELKDYFSKNRIWDCFISVGNKIEKISMEPIDFSTGYFPSINTSFELKLYKTKINTFAIAVKLKEIPINNINGSIINNLLMIDFSMPADFLFNSNDKHNICLAFKKRIQPDILYHQQVISFPLFKSNDNDYSAKVDLLKLIKGDINQPKSTWDIYIFIKNEESKLINEYPFIIDPDSNLVGVRHFILNNVDIKFYRNYRKALSLTNSINKRLFELDYIEFDGFLKIDGRVKNLFVEKFVLKKESLYENGELTNNIKELPFKQYEENLTAVIPIKEIFNGIRLENNSNYTFYMELRDVKRQVKFHAPVFIERVKMLPSEPIKLNNEYQAQLTILTSKLAIKCKNKTLETTNNSLKIAVSGSCFSRLAFSSNSFYNPNYKKKYQLVYTQFHSSIISLMSNPVTFPEKEFKGFNEVEVNYLRSDFKKDFFEQLNVATPDFLILDFYVDGSKDVLLFDKNHIVTINYMLRRNMNYLYKLGEEATVLSHKNIQSYLLVWRKAIENFAEKIVKFVPEERIILQRVRKTDEYKTEEGKVEKFKGKVRHVKRSNYLFEYMEEYFMKLLPNIKIINLGKRKYYSLYNHPENNTPDHLESEYYKDFMNQLDDITIQYLLQRNNS